MIIASVVLVRAALTTDGRKPKPSPMYQQGEQLLELREIGFEDSNATLVLWLSTKCSFCERSMGFYRRLASQRGRARLVVSGTEPEATLDAYVERHGFQPDKIVSTKGARPPKLTGTPTLILVDKNGVVKRVWLGMLGNPADEEAVLSAIKM